MNLKMCVYTGKRGKEKKGAGLLYICSTLKLLTHPCLDPMSDTQSMKYGKVERRKGGEIRSLPGHPRIE